jgi:hypothetical protein
LPGRRSRLRRRILDSGIGFLHQGKLIDLHPVDLHGNARSPRSRRDDHRDPPKAVPPATAADLAFQHDFGPVVEGDGGLDLPHDDDIDFPQDIPW